jgi:amino acid permease
MAAPGYRNEDGMKGNLDIPVEKYENGSTALPKQQSLKSRILDSFKRAEVSDGVIHGIDPENSVPHAGDTSNLHRKLKGRHIQMIAIGGAIGAGLFIGSGKALATGGPGAVMLDFGLIGLMLFCTVNALGELATLFPVQGTFSSLFSVPISGLRLNVRIVHDFLNSVY